MFIILNQEEPAKPIRVNSNSISSYRNIFNYRKSENSDKFNYYSVTEILLNTGDKFNVLESPNEIDVLLRTFTQVIKGYQTIKED